MLSLERYRQLLGGGDWQSVSDSEIEHVRDEARLLGQAVIAMAIRKRAEGTRFQQALRLVPELDRDEIEERAAIQEFDGSVSRDRAERLAVVHHLRRKP